MAHDDYKEGWGVVDSDGLNVNTVGDTRQTAIVNWLFSEVGMLPMSNCTDESIQAAWEANRGDAVCSPIRLYVK